MTDIEMDVDTLARRIADRGHDALLQRLRTAYADAAAAHADLISLDGDQIEAMVQAAAENADGLQWRRAMASVAAEELGISVTQALTHPAVSRAQSLVGAPSYEQSLAELIARPVPPPTPRPQASAQPVSDPPAAADNGSVASPAEPAGVHPEPEPPVPAPEPVPEPGPEPDPEPEPPMPGPSLDAEQAAAHTSDELETVEADDVMLELLPEPDPIEYETEVYDVEASFVEEEPHAHEPFAAGAAAEPEPEPYGEPAEPELVIPAIHQGGVANLPTKREGLGIRLSVDGLDILQGEHEIVGRLIWDEIETLEVPDQRARRRRSEPKARLLVRTPHGDASFDIPGISAVELRDRVEPLVRLYGHQ